MDESDTMLEMELAVMVLEVGELELEATDVPVAVLGGEGLEMGITGGAFGNVVFRAGHPEDSVSRRTGQ